MAIWSAPITQGLDRRDRAWGLWILHGKRRENVGGGVPHVQSVCVSQYMQFLLFLSDPQARDSTLMIPLDGTLEEGPILIMKGPLEAIGSLDFLTGVSSKEWIDKLIISV